MLNALYEFKNAISSFDLKIGKKHHNGKQTHIVGLVEQTDEHPGLVSVSSPISKLYTAHKRLNRGFTILCNPGKLDTTRERRLYFDIDDYKNGEDPLTRDEVELVIDLWTQSIEHVTGVSEPRIRRYRKLTSEGISESYSMHLVADVAIRSNGHFVQQYIVDHLAKTVTNIADDPFNPISEELARRIAPVIDNAVGIRAPFSAKSVDGDRYNLYAPVEWIEENADLISERGVKFAVDAFVRTASYVSICCDGDILYVPHSCKTMKENVQMEQDIAGFIEAREAKASRYAEIDWDQGLYSSVNVDGKYVDLDVDLAISTINQMPAWMFRGKSWHNSVACVLSLSEDRESDEMTRILEAFDQMSCKASPNEHNHEHNWKIYMSRKLHGVRSGGFRTLVEEQHMSGTAKCIKRAQTSKPQFTIPANERVELPDFTEYTGYDLQDCIDNRVAVCIKSECGTGKSRWMAQFLEARPEISVLMISYRRTLASEMYAKYERLGFSHYSYIEGDINERRVIVQYESLHRVCRPEGFDLLVLDESESIVKQTRSPYARDTRIFPKFRHFVESTPGILAMDALLSTDITLDFLRSCQRELYIVENTVKKSGDVIIVENEKRILACVENAATSGKKMVIYANSLKKSKVIHKMLAAKVPGAKIHAYSSESSESDRAIMMNTRKRDALWSTLDVLIYTPSVEAGISFEMKHFDIAVGYIVGSSCDTAAVIQMMNRVRDIGTKTHLMYIKSQPKYGSVKVDQIEQTMLNERASLVASDASWASTLPVAFDPTTNKYSYPYKDDYYHLRVRLMALYNKDQNAFRYNLIKRLVDSGLNVRSMSDKLDAKRTIEINQRIAEANTAVVNETTQNLHVVTLGTELESEALTNHLSYVSSAYGMIEGDERAGLIATKTHSVDIERYRTHTAIVASDDFMDEIQEFERNKHVTAGDAVSDAVYEFKYHKLKLTIDMLAELGIEDEVIGFIRNRDEDIVFNCNDLAERFKQSEHIVDALGEYNRTFGIRADKRRGIVPCTVGKKKAFAILNYITKLMNVTLGVSLKRVSRKKPLFRLECDIVPVAECTKSYYSR